MTFLKTYWPGLLLLLISVFIGISVYQDYGISTDEYAQREIGSINYNFIAKGDTTFIDYYEKKPNTFYKFYSKDHGPAFELVLSTLENKLHLTDTRDIFLMRHITGYLLFALCMFAGYVLAYKLFNNQFIACFAFIALMFEPRIFAHSFFNSKDIPSLSIFMLCLACCKWAFDKNKLIPYLLLGVLCGYGIAIRVPNMVIAAPIYLFFLIDIINNYKQKKSNKIAISGVTGFTVLMIVTMIAFWPLLWKSPVFYFVDSYKSLSKFYWDGQVLLGGIVYPAKKISWSYIPTWFFITVPELLLLLGFTGIILILADMVRKPMDFVYNSNKRNYFLFLYCFITPVLMVIILKSVVYDDWRHVYFIYPGFVLLACYALSEFFKRKLTAIIVKAACIAQIVVVAFFMVKNHPYEQVYFNNLVSHKENYLIENYELDYWGNSYKNGLEWILAHSASDSIYVNDNWPVAENIGMLAPDKRKRFRTTSNIDQVQYFIEHFRTGHFIFPKEASVYDIRVLNSPILRVSKLR